MLVCRLFSLFMDVVLFMRVCSGSLFFRSMLFFLLFGFLFIRVPYMYGVGGFGLFVVCVVLPLFLVLLGRRICGSVLGFLSSFVPEGSPVLIAPLVCGMEVISYFIRPVVLMFRPFFNLTGGAILGHSLGGWCYVKQWLILAWLFLFFYEVFVGLMHWYMVSDILAFSEDH